jgi:hypothetical protein
VRFRGCDDLVEAVRSILLGWAVRDVDPAGLPPPVLRLQRTRHGYRRVSCWQHRPSLARKKVRATLVEALCGFHFEFLDWYIEQHPEALFVHGAAVRFGRRLVVFPALAKAGKSTLTVHLAQRGHLVFCDDVLAIDTGTGRGTALGIVPRLRPPLPRDAGRGFRAFVAARRGLGRGNRLYVSLRKGELAPLGTTAHIGGIVLLERAPRRRASLTAIDPADALETIILQNFARDRPSPVILDTLARVTAGAECRRLVYARGSDAARLLEEAFGANPVRTTTKGARA